MLTQHLQHNNIIKVTIIPKLIKHDNTHANPACTTLLVFKFTFFGKTVYLKHCKIIKVKIIPTVKKHDNTHANPACTTLLVFKFKFFWKNTAQL
jgi:hypothetical protein